MTEKHFCVTTYIVDRKYNKCLMIFHKKLNKWIPPGGHIEPNEGPVEAALREVKEETGLTVELLGEKLPREMDILVPYGMQKNYINEDHIHMDFIYLGVVDNSDMELSNEEGLLTKWFTLAEIEKEDFNTFEETSFWYKKFIDLVNDM
ncbi:NUDIX domain-containing protein [Mycoplasmatota bacterium zrk1]